MYRLLIVVAGMICASGVPADSFRCGRSMVKIGDSNNTLVKKCGNPDRTYKSRETINDHGRRFEAGVINWVYERDRNGDVIVSVYNGAITKIRVD